MDAKQTAITRIGDVAVYYGNIEVLLKWANWHGCSWDELICSEAASSNRHLEVVKWAKKWMQLGFQHVSWHAARRGHLHVLKWPIRNGCNWNCIKGSFGSLTMGQKPGLWLEASRTICSVAAGKGHLNALKWEHNNGCDWNSWTCSNATEYGHLEILPWARKR